MKNVILGGLNIFWFDFNYIVFVKLFLFNRLIPLLLWVNGDADAIGVFYSELLILGRFNPFFAESDLDGWYEFSDILAIDIYIIFIFKIK